jgi:hypothetical protein
MGTGAGAGGGILLHRFFEEVTMLVCQRMAIPHMRNLILGWRIIDDSLETGV